MLESLVALATAGSTALVGAMATDVWGAARGGILLLLGRRDVAEEGEPAGLAAQLDGDAALVSGSGDTESARRSLLPSWTLRLEQFLRAHPEAADEMRELVERLTCELPRAEQHWAQHVVANDRSQVFAAQGGNVIVHHDHVTRPLPPPEPGPTPEPGSGSGSDATA